MIKLFRRRSEVRKEEFYQKKGGLMWQRGQGVPPQKEDSRVWSLQEKVKEKAKRDAACPKEKRSISLQPWGKTKRRDEEGQSELGARLFPVSTLRRTDGTGRPRTTETTRGGRIGGTVSVHRYQTEGGSALWAQAGPLPGRLLFLVIVFFFVLIVWIIHQTHQSSLS